jgi:hypothetical protein
MINPANHPPVVAITSPTTNQVVDANGIVRVAWTYSDSDANVQSSYEVGWRVVGDSTWTTVTGSNANGYHDFPIYTPFTDNNYEVRVRANDGTVWSNYANVLFSTFTWTTLTVTNGTTPNGTLNTAGFTQGDYEIQVRAVDNMGSTGAWSTNMVVPLGPPTNVYVKVGGVWKQSMNYVKVAGTFKQAPPTKKNTGGNWS